MASVNFHLRDTKTTGKTSIILSFNFGKRLKLSTGISIKTNEWDERKQRIKKTTTGCVDLNATLNRMEEDILTVYNKAVKDAKLITIDYIKGEFKKVQGGIEEKDFHQFFAQFKEESKNKKTASTIKTYTVCYNVLKAYEKAKRKKITFDSIDLDFYRSLESYCFGVREFSTNYFGKVIKVLKTVLNEATERGINKNLAFRSSKFKRSAEASDHIYLNEGELELIYTTKLTGHLERARDLFIVGCYTGLRFQDFSNIRHENIKDKCIYIKTTKTNEDVVIPIHPKVRALLNKYKDVYDTPLPPAYTNQVMNRHLKEIGKKAGLDNDELVSVNKAGQRIEEQKKRYELISTHTARRSFATNTYLAGVQSIAIMKITGHKTETAFLKYIKVSPEENAIQLLNHPFFAKNENSNLKIA